MLYYIQIQGRHASRFGFKNQSAENFKTVVESITNGAAAVISSSYRTDVLFTADEDRKESIFKLWSLYTGEIMDFNPKKFSLFEGRNEVLHYFFSSLVSLSKMGDWYNEYLKEFRAVCRQECNNPIIKELIACENFLQTNGKTLKRPTVNFLPNVKSSRTLLSDLARRPSGSEN